jgi:hypothetical protein
VTSTDDTQDQSEEEDKPRGTLFIMICFLIMLIGMWTWVYVEMIAG